MTRPSETAVICVGLALGAVLLAGSSPPSQKHPASNFFADPKVAELAEAAARGDVERIDSLVAEGVDVNARGEEGLTPLLYAMLGTTTRGFQRLLERGADPNYQLENGDSAVTWAAGGRDPERVKILLEMLKILIARGADPNLRDLPSMPRNANSTISRPTPIYHARGHESARILIKAGADVDFQDDSRDTPMMDAALFKRFDVVYALLAGDADFRLEDLRGLTLAKEILDRELDPMSEAAAWRRKCIEFMENSGVDFQEEKLWIDDWYRRREELFRRADEAERRGEYSGRLGWYSRSVAGVLLAGTGFRLHRFQYNAKDFFADPKVAELAEAAAQGDAERVDALVDEGVDANARGEHGLTPLIYAMSGKNIQGFQRLLERGADPNQHMHFGESAMKWAAYQDESGHLKMLLAHGGDPNLRYPTAEKDPTPLHWAIQGPSVENARILIDGGADPRGRGANGSPLMLAARDGRFDMVYGMLEADADFRPKKRDHYSLAQRILLSDVAPGSPGEKWRQKCIQLLLEKGVDFESEKPRVEEIKRQDRERAKVWAATTRIPHALSWLTPTSVGAVLVNGYDLRRREHHAKEFFADPKVAELAEAAARGDVGQVDALAAEGVDVNAKGQEGLTPLVYAMIGTNTKGFERLLKRGDDPNQKMLHGESAIHCA
ncbi:MAG: ankyrin repeat domain-containing protein, partial [Planctomycetes bacterium]|nr:ankyrin repeat domain-containing protein [Planctomycetota bacterium]